MTPDNTKNSGNQIASTALSTVLALAALACVAFAICDLWSHNLSLEARLTRFAITISVFMLMATGIGKWLAIRVSDIATKAVQTVVIEQTSEQTVVSAQLDANRQERFKAEGELKNLREEIEMMRRSAGMADFAAGVLHNVGNVLNSVNVSATNQSNLLMSSKLAQLERVVDLLEKDEAELVEFFTQNDKGKQLPRFLRVLFDHLMEEKQLLFEQSQSLIKNVDHLKSIISTQQSYATSGGLLEPVEVETLFEDAVNLHTESFTRHGIKIKREYAEIPPALLDKQRVMQIVINLVKNAKEAMHGEKDGAKAMTLITRVDGDRLLLEVTDTGMGIDSEHLPKMFSHGFTTKASGHGFGLHSCANAANEMDGCLSCQSPGIGRGATFTLSLPFQPAMAHV
jgi:signal transduction histidine kinase